MILALGNGPELQGDITGILPSGSVMAVKVTAATSKGEILDEKEWIQVQEACEMMFGLDQVKKTILEYVESRISLLAPNISAIVGTTTATKILGIAGGLQGLNRIPHSNIYVSLVSHLTPVSHDLLSGSLMFTGQPLYRSLEQSNEQILGSQPLRTLSIDSTRVSSTTVPSYNKLDPKTV